MHCVVRQQMPGGPGCALRVSQHSIRLPAHGVLSERCIGVTYTPPKPPQQTMCEKPL
ncbi:hypothetical protein OAN61_00585 [bacterium]|nr:hypothetical protein [bacterium]